MATVTASELLHFNGVNGTTGEYLLPPLSPADIVQIARGEGLDRQHVGELKFRHGLFGRGGRYDVVAGVDQTKLEETGWGVIFARDADPAVRDALRELLDLRKGQAGSQNEHYYREFTGRDGYHSGESKQKFLERFGVGPGPVNPDKIPYYLLIVGDPETIPFRFQYQLDVQFAVGRIWFETPEEYARYARSVVDAETGKVALPRRAVFFGAQNPEDPATQLSARDLVSPMPDAVFSRWNPELPRWDVQTVIGEAATKARLARLLGGDDTPALLFTASHGMGFPNGDPRQLPHQGALLCSDWPGPARWRRAIPPDHYFAADDVGDDARLLGMVSFHFACYGAGTPKLDDFAHLAFRRANEIAPHAFLARLPRRLLSHPRGGALAVVGHVERAWGYSFVWERAGKQLEVFESAFRQLMQNVPIGHALAKFNERYAELSTLLSDELEQVKVYGKQPDEYELAGMWTANNDARSYVILGDPAVRIPAAANPGGERPRPVIAEVIAPPLPAAAPARGDGPAGRTEGRPDGPAARDVERPDGPGTFTAEEGGTTLAAQVSATESRFRRRESARESFSPATGVRGLLATNSPERLRWRLRRLGLTPASVESFLTGSPAFAVLEGEPQPVSPAALLERILGKNDMVKARFLHAGARAARTVARIRVRSRSGRLLGYGTGFLVAPRLLLTNNHVLGSAASAAPSLVEFNFEDGADDRPLAAEAFGLAPRDFFLTDEALDFTLVAVQPQNQAGREPAAFGWNRVLEEDDPVLVEEYVNIVQHPGGRTKQVALRDNQVIDLLDDFLHYRADTEPGSSGSPVFNDQWELVALHHSGVPRRDADGNILARGGGVWTDDMGEEQIDWIANEGVRLSRILRHVKGQPMSTETQRRLRDSLFQGPPPADGGPAPAVTPTEQALGPVMPVMPAQGAGGEVSITIPLQISVRLGMPMMPGLLSAVSVPQSVALPQEQPGVIAVPFGEAVTIDPDYENREGYDPDFLGGGPLRVPMPKLSEAQERDAARMRNPEPGESPYELKYNHFSVVMNGRRRLALVTAVNIDGRAARNPRRENDRWFFDPRVRRDEQAGEELYASNPFDRGHLVRRLDPAWGRTARIARVANDDTFHFTNCSPQHSRFNQGKNLWAGLEDYLLNKAADERRRLTVFTGPVFAADDPTYRGVQVPRQYWKVAVVTRPNNRLAVLAFVVSQADLIRPVVEEAAIDVARTFQVPVRRVEELTGLSFGRLRELDAGTVARFGLEGSEVRVLESFEDIALPDAAPAPAVFATGAESARGNEPVPGTDLSYYLIAYDDDLAERSDGPAGRVSKRVLTALGREPVTDVFLFSHGWQGDVPAAREQYQGWVQAMARMQPDRERMRQVRPNFTPLLVGLHWPSLPWGDERLEGMSFSAAGAVEAKVEAFARRLGKSDEIRRLLRIIVTAAQVGGEPERLPPELADAYRALDRALGMGAGGVAAAPGKDREGFDPEAVYQDARRDSGTGAAVSFGLFSTDNLLSPLRSLSFWKMKDRARQFGEEAVHPLLVKMQEAAAGKDVRFHLTGHSFGCIVASAAACGPEGSAALPQPIDSLCLLQGALSLWAYCTDIPFARGRAGYFARLFTEGRLRGPAVTTLSSHDRAVGTWYPRAAGVARQVAFAAELPRYGGIGTHGIQGPGLSVSDEPMLPADGSYLFQGGRVYNLDGSAYIRQGGGFSGAHSDIRGPEVAHAVWSAVQAARP